MEEPISRIFLYSLVIFADNKLHKIYHMEELSYLVNLWGQEVRKELNSIARKVKTVCRFLLSLQTQAFIVISCIEVNLKLYAMKGVFECVI